MIAGLGAILATPWLFGGTNISYSMAWGMPLAVVSISVMALALRTVGSYLTFSGEIELKAKSYASYTRGMDTSRFDPVGAADIYYYAWWSRDSSISFYRMSIPLDDFARLLAATPAKWDTRNRPCAFEKSPTSADALSAFSRQGLLDEKPHWWDPKESSTMVAYVLGCDDGRGLKPLAKAVWIYDNQSQVLWIAAKTP
jgi:hypothetical protein